VSLSPLVLQVKVLILPIWAAPVANVSGPPSGARVPPVARVPPNAVKTSSSVFHAKYYYATSFVLPVPQLLGNEICRGAAEKAVSFQNDDG